MKSKVRTEKANSQNLNYCLTQNLWANQRFAQSHHGKTSTWGDAHFFTFLEPTFGCCKIKQIKEEIVLTCINGPQRRRCPLTAKAYLLASRCASQKED